LTKILEELRNMDAHWSLVIVTFLLLVVTYLYARQTKKLANDTKRMADIMKADYDIRVSPLLEVNFPSRDRNGAGVTLINRGECKFDVVKIALVWNFRNSQDPEKEEDPQDINKTLFPGGNEIKETLRYPRDKIAQSYNQKHNTSEESNTAIGYCDGKMKVYLIDARNRKHEKIYDIGKLVGV